MARRRARPRADRRARLPHEPAPHRRGCELHVLSPRCGNVVPPPRRGRDHEPVYESERRHLQRPRRCGGDALTRLLLVLALMTSASTAAAEKIKPWYRGFYASLGWRDTYGVQ